MVMPLFRQTISDCAMALRNMIVPPVCLTCEALVTEQGGCCPSCWRELRFIAKPLCPVMGIPHSVDMGEGFLSTEAIAHPPPFERLRAVMLYDRLARRMVSSLKYADRTDLARWMAAWMAVAGKELLAEADFVLPVPLHPGRLRSRRFNQSAELARNLVQGVRVKHSPELLKRKKATRQQVGLSERERERNVTGAFVVPQELKLHLKNRRVLLVDDVYTTGATSRAATRALLRGGASAVDVLVFAKVETHLLEAV